MNPDLKDDGTKQEMEGRLFGRVGLLRRERFDEGMVKLIPAKTREFFETPTDLYSKAHRIQIGRALGGVTSIPHEKAPFAVYNGISGFSVE